MLILKKTFSDGGILAVSKIVETMDDMLRLCCGYNSYFDNLCLKSKREKIAVRLLLQQLSVNTQIVYDNNGKPMLLDSTQNISISHSKDFVAIFLHPIFSVGVDIEQRSNRSARLCERFLSADEMMPNVENEPYAELCWCAKETIYKMMSEEKITDFFQIKIEPFLPDSEGKIKAIEFKTQENRAFLLSYIQNDEFSLTWGTTNK